MAEAPPSFNPLKPAGFLLLIMGWILVLSAIVLLKPGIPRTSFTGAGLLVELLGLVLFVRSHIAPKPERN